MGFVDVGAQSAAGSTADTLSAVALPTHSEGDFLLIMATAHGSTDTTATASGYSSVANYEQGSGGSRLEITLLGKFAGASETAPDVAFGSASGGSLTAQIASFSDVHADILDVAAVTSGNTSSEDPFTPTGITTSTDGAEVLSIVTTTDNNELALDTAQGFTLRAGGADYDTTSGSDGSFGLATKTQATADTVTCPTWDETAFAPDPWASITIALKPAGGATQTLTGSLFQKAPTFPAGQVDLGTVGSLFSKTPTFPTGRVDFTALGSLFASTPSFPAGVLTPSNVLSGVLFQKGFAAPNLLTTTRAGPGQGLAGGSGGPGEGVAQSFYGYGTLTTVTLWLTKIGTPTDDLTVSVVTELDGIPVATSDAVGSATVGVGSAIDFTFSSPPVLSAGTRYFIQLKRSGARDVANFVSWLGDELADQYLPGQSWEKDTGVWRPDVPPPYTVYDFKMELDAIAGGSAVIAQQTLTGVLFQSAPSFPTGALTLTTLLTGSLFQKAPTFPAGQIDLTILGSLFTPTVGFPAGTISTPSVQTLTGILYQNTPAFPTGTITAVVDLLTGTLFTPTILFPAGTLIGGQTLTGILYTNTPVFPTGTVVASDILTGVLYAAAPAFPAGQLDLTVLGEVFEPTIVFPTGQLIVPVVNYQWYVRLIDQNWEIEPHTGMWVLRPRT